MGYLTAGMENVAISNAIDANYPSSVQVFTRDGRQILGQPLDDEQAATLVQDSRGFVKGATYSAAYLNQTADSPYRDMSVFYGIRPRHRRRLISVTRQTSGLVRRHFLSFDRVNSARLETGPIQAITNSTGAELEVVAASDLSLQGIALPALTISDGDTLDAGAVSSWVNQHAIDNGLALTARVIDRIETPLSKLKLTGPRRPRSDDQRYEHQRWTGL